jgi:hypothetical protein
MPNRTPLCPVCQKPTTFEKEGPPEEPNFSGGAINMPLDSDIYRCAEHGLFRIYISGAAKRYSE